MAVLGVFIEQISLRAYVGDRRHDQLLANRVNGGVSDLREKLLEVVEQELRPVRETSQRDIDAHGADRLLTHGRHGTQNHAPVFHGVAEHALALEQGVEIRALDLLRLRQILGVDQLLIKPFAIRLPRRIRLLDFLVLDDAAFFRVDEEHATGLQPPLVTHVLRSDFQYAGLGRHHDQVVVRDVVTRRTQPVAIEHASDVAAIGEYDRGRTVPRLHQRGVKLVEGFLVVLHVLVRAPRLGDQHHHGVRCFAATFDQQLQSVVDHGRVAASFVDDRRKLLDVVPEQRGRKCRFPRPHPIDIASQGVDLTVVRQIAEWLRTLPGRKSIG